MKSAKEIVTENRRELVERLIAQMEKGYAATREMWSKTGNGRPYNPTSNTIYKGGNRFRLMFAAEEMGFSDPRWMTFKQAQEKKYRIAPGAKSVLLEKYITHREVPVLDENQQPVIGADGQPEMRQEKLAKPYTNFFRVFNGEQIIGLPELTRRDVTEDMYSEMADMFERSSECPVDYEFLQDQAYYSVKEDKIHLPQKSAFKNNETRLSVLLHEMAHSTGHHSRLNRPLANGFGTEEYAKEELNAELSSAFIENDLGIALEQDSEMMKDHSNYLRSWISVLKKDPDVFFKACTVAEDITGFLVERYEKQRQLELKNEHNPEALARRIVECFEDKLFVYGQIHGLFEYGEMDRENWVNTVRESIIQNGTKPWENALKALAEEVSDGDDIQKTLEKINRYNEHSGVVEETIMAEKVEKVDEKVERRLPEETAVTSKSEIEFYTKGLQGAGSSEQIIYESFGDAFKAYQEAGPVQGKMIGFTLDREHFTNLVCWEESSKENLLLHVDNVQQRFRDYVPPREMLELVAAADTLTEVLHQENCVQRLTTMVQRVAEPAVDLVQKGLVWGAWLGRAVNTNYPEDYITIDIQGIETTQELIVDINCVQENEIVRTQGFTVSADDVREKGILAFDEEKIKDIMRELLQEDFDLSSKYGQVPFDFYSPHGGERMEVHYQALRERAMDECPSYDKFLAKRTDKLKEQIRQDIVKSGFKPTETLVENICKLSSIERKEFTLKELAQLQKEKAGGFKNPMSKEYYSNIVKECQEQELARVRETPHFLKQEMLIEQMTGMN